MHIDIPQTLSHEALAAYEMQHLLLFRLDCSRDRFQKRQNFMPVFEVSANELSDDEWMTGDIPFIQQGF